MDYISIILLLVSIANVFYGTFVFNRNRNSYSARIFFLLTMVMTIWGTSMFLLREATSIASAIIYIKLLYTSAALIPLFSVFFALQFPHVKNQISKHILFMLLLPIPFVLWLIWSPGMLIDGVVISLESSTHEPAVFFNKIQHVFYTFYISCYFILAHIFLFRTYREQNKVVAHQIFYMLIGTISTISISTVTNVILPLSGNFSLNWVGPTATTLMFFTVSYSIYRHRAFNLRVQFSEVLAILLVGLALIDLLTSIYYTGSTSIFLWKLLTTAIIIFVAKSFLDGLFAAQKQTAKLKKLNKELKELDEKKTEFLHIATHQLRGPVTAINGYASMLGDGDYGPLNKKVKVTISKILSAGIVMRETISDYMNIARIEENRLNQAPTNFKLCDLVTDRVSILQEVAHKKGLEIILTPTEGAHDCEVHADRENITQVVNALLENAIKYTKKGTITLTPEKSEDGKSGMLHITDTGIGVAPKDLDGLFRKFARASNAKAINIFGTGMGLFIAKSLTEANGGGVTVHSDGLNKGTTFTIELPIVN